MKSPPDVSVVSGPHSYGASGEIFAMVDRCLAALGLPADFIQPGNHVVLKPNWVKEHDERRPGADAWEHMITHPVVIEAVALWAADRLQGNGRVTICDAPQTDSSFDKIRSYCGLDEVLLRCQAAHPRVEFTLLDLRPEEWNAQDGITVSKRQLPGDPEGAATVALNSASEFVDFPGEGRLYGASYDMEETNRHHHGEVHEYRLCRTPMDADVLINLPKLKTHKKVGMTCALKNMVGINAEKNWLPHHTEGTPIQGGDQFPKATTKTRLEHTGMGALKRWTKKSPILSRCLVPLKKIGRLLFGDTQKVVRSGNWHGNDTCWRMVVDLNKCLFHFNGRGDTRTKPLNYLTLVDAIVAGEGNGPMSPDPKPCGMLIAGRDPAAVDAAAARLMGFDPFKLRVITGAFAARLLPITHLSMDELFIASNKPQWNGRLADIRDTFTFKPHFGWVGSIEYSEPPSASAHHTPPVGNATTRPTES